MSVGNCRACMYWDAYGPEEEFQKGFCRRNSPTYVLQKGTVWPETFAFDWCGGFVQLSNKTE